MTRNNHTLILINELPNIHTFTQHDQAKPLQQDTSHAPTDTKQDTSHVPCQTNTHAKPTQKLLKPITSQANSPKMEYPPNPPPSPVHQQPLTYLVIPICLPLP